MKPSAEKIRMNDTKKTHSIATAYSHILQKVGSEASSGVQFMYILCSHISVTGTWA